VATQPNILGDRFEDVVPNRPGLLRVKDVARMLAVSEKTVYAWVAGGEMPYLKIGAAVRFRPAAIREWLWEKEFLPRGLGG
jgi:excisionase family DNA binding protein